MTLTWTFEQAHDQGGNPIPNSYEIIETGRDGVPVIVGEVYTEDNARVIAASLDMLATLKAILENENPHPDVRIQPDHVYQGRIAIAKAEGRS